MFWWWSPNTFGPLHSLSPRSFPFFFGDGRINCNFPCIFSPHCFNTPGRLPVTTLLSPPSYRFLLQHLLVLQTQYDHLGPFPPACCTVLFYLLFFLFCFVSCVFFVSCWLGYVVIPFVCPPLTSGNAPPVVGFTSSSLGIFRFPFVLSRLGYGQVRPKAHPNLNLDFSIPHYFFWHLVPHPPLPPYPYQISPPTVFCTTFTPLKKDPL